MPCAQILVFEGVFVCSLHKLTPMSGESAVPASKLISAERKDEGGLVTLRLVGKYEASFMVTEPEQ